jgi:transketolase
MTADPRGSLPDALRRFAAPALTAEHRERLADAARRLRRDILVMTTRAGSGHVGGALSSIDILLVLYAAADIAPESADDPARDRIVVSHGHVSAAVYACLGLAGFLDPADALAGFRRAGSPFEGHPGASVPGIEWASGALGQGLSVGCGFALASRFAAVPWHVYVVMGDGEQQKGQIAEARAFAAARGLSNLTAIVDCNRLQATGAVADIMPQRLEALYAASGWAVCRADGHDPADLYAKLRACRSADRPGVILADTVMGKGVSFIEHRVACHGAPLAPADLDRALVELGLPAEDPSAGPPAADRRPPTPRSPAAPPPETRIALGPPARHPAGRTVDLRAAWGNAIADLVKRNAGSIAVLDCDLGPSVKTDAVRDARPERFIQCGIQEHHAASMAAALSRAGVLAFWADFGVFALDEVYSQLRMADMNRASVKIIATHCGLDVGADGKTHQCIDYIGLAASLMTFRLIIPADANQMDAAVRYVATTPGNFIVACGRSPWPVIAAPDGRPFFGEAYAFVYGAPDWLAAGEDGVIVTCGAMAHRALAARPLLEAQGIRAGVLNVSCPLALDLDALRGAARTGYLLVYEDHHRATGLGARVASACADLGLACRVRTLGISAYGGSGAPEELYARQGLGAQDCAAVFLADRPPRAIPPP